ncbi:alpha/beta hydrolase-fold protein [Microbacterium sp. HD4P20]|uniref:alpha/beta hydrolase-fold protein n=1 Tax=Microbacterium sp. HD4P20 TaxID=2864874 RepID=UPI001C6406C7|nr:alpha/beta hydrolase-fold protein [Microbacterium sp. HD4P20]MCP2635614.1 alpha/beta hydrolase-fold protein [Microbacterium sp. HD4P20]
MNSPLRWTGSRHTSQHPSAGRWRWAGATGAVAALAAGAMTPATAAYASGTPDAPGLSQIAVATGPSTGLPDGMPAAALAPEPELPVPAAWGFSEAFPRTSGTSRIDDGTLLWSDWLYDDTGTGAFTYLDEAAASNGADIFRAAIATDAANTYWRVDWNTLVDADVPIAAWTFDTDADATTGVAEWPAQAGAHSPGIDSALVVSSRGAWLTDAETGDRISVASVGGTLSVDAAARSFVVAVPHDALPVDGNWRVRLAGGVADAEGTAFAPAPETAEGTRIYNAAFRDVADEPHLVGGYRDSSTQWNNGRQSEQLREGSMADFSLDVDWAALQSGASTAETIPTGYSTRWYVSSVEIAQGRDPGARKSPGPQVLPATFWGRVQPYTVYVPASYTPESPAPLTILLHGGDANHNGFAGDHKDSVYLPMCEERGSICLSPMGRGLSTWYINHGELDVWEAWARTADAFSIDPDRTVIGGFSMGGVGATRFLTTHPDLFAGGAIVSGAGYYNSAGQRDREGAELRLENLGDLHTFMDSGSRDIALGNTQRWDRAAEAAGIPYRAHYYEGADHGMLGTRIGWSDVAEYLDPARTREANPADIAFRWEPGDERVDLGMPVDRAYWLDGLEPRDATARWSRVDARSLVMDTVVFEPRLTDETTVIDGRTVQVRDQQLVAIAEVAPGNRIEVDASNVAALTIDLDRAALDQSAPAAVVVTTDGPTDVTLRRGSLSSTLTVAAGEHVLAGPDAPTSVRAAVSPAGTRVHWRPAKSESPLTGYTVRDAGGDIVCQTRAVTCRVTDAAAGATFSVTATNLVGTSEGASSGPATPRGR